MRLWRSSHAKVRRVIRTTDNYSEATWSFGTQAKPPAPPTASHLHGLVGQASACQRPLAGALEAPPWPVGDLAECGHECAAGGGVERVLRHADFGNLDGKILGPQRRGKSLQKALWYRRPAAQDDGHRLIRSEERRKGK